MKHIIRTTTLIFMFTLGGRAFAMDAFEYEVYDGEVNKPGVYSLETHLNENAVGKTDPDYEGQIPTDELTHLTFEFIRGLAEDWEIGLYLQTAIKSDMQARWAGVKLRTKYVVPREALGDWEAGLNVELAAVPAPFEEDNYALEIRPVVGYHLARFTLTVNPIIDFDLKSGANHSPALAPAAKLALEVAKGHGAAIEYYGDVGLTDGFLTPGRTEQYVFGAYDYKTAGYMLNVGVGGGLTPMSNPLVAKVIFGFEFN